MKEENKGLVLRIVLSVLLVVLTGGAVFVCSYLYTENEYQMIRNVVMAVMGALVVLDVYWISAAKHNLDYQNEEGEKFGRFCVIYFIGVLFAVTFPMLPSAGWPYMVVFVALACFSNMTCGITTGSVLLMITIMLSSNLSAEIFILYFMSGVVAVALFQNVDEAFKVGVPILLSLSFLLVCETANVVLFVNEKLNLELFVIPVINVIISAIMLVVILKVYNAQMVNKYRDKYQIINDQEYPLMAELKEKHREEYYHTIHTAYLSDRIAKKLHLNEAVTKAASYYLKMGVLCENNDWENIEQVCTEHQFPKEVKEVLKECLYTASPKQKETVVVVFADEVIAALQDIFAKDKEAVVDYAQLVDKIFRKKIERGLLRDNLITYSELQTMRKIFVEEKLYYDFLR